MEFEPTFRLRLLSEKSFFREIKQVRETLRRIGRTGTCVSFDGCRLAFAYYPAENSRGSVVIVHGFTEFYEKYAELAWYFLQMGYSVFLYDQRGHGHSSRYTKNLYVVHVRDFTDYAKDLSCFLESVVLPTAPGSPVYLLGHSMGGTVVLRYLLDGGRDAERAVLSSPMLCPKTGNAPASLLKAALPLKALRHGWDSPYRKEGSRFNPNTRFPTRSDGSYVRFQSNMEFRVQDPCYQTSTGSVRWLYEALHVQDWLNQPDLFRKIEADVLLIRAGKDQVVEEKPLYRLPELLPRCEFVTLYDAKHAIYTGTNQVLRPYCEVLFRFFGR